MRDLAYNTGAPHFDRAEKTKGARATMSFCRRSYGRVGLLHFELDRTGDRVRSLFTALPGSANAIEWGFCVVGRALSSVCLCVCVRARARSWMPTACILANSASRSIGLV